MKILQEGNSRYYYVYSKNEKKQITKIKYLVF